MTQTYSRPYLACSRIFDDIILDMLYVILSWISSGMSSVSCTIDVVTRYVLRKDRAVRREERQRRGKSEGSEVEDNTS